ncbi:ras-related protein Rab-17 isoform X1 [Echinops telfairi]|uniref:Ras-related protein Rab-17 isoform X1 n=1 Tax=Echinops telfairi TaxID=9371 RepID=A0AC55DJN3_ECHTE|nr:ras-related protein Rab-17 isoform X1 [Echinops telfairi]
MLDPDPAHTFKLVLLGSESVGKSSLALRFVKDDFRSGLPTVGCAFFTKVVQVGVAPLKFEIWDTAGQEKYHSVCRLYFRGANAALLVYDVASKESFLRAQQWLRDLEGELLPSEVVVMLVGNKTDLTEEREVTSEEGKAFAESKGLLFAETSAKQNHQPKSYCGEKRSRQARGTMGTPEWISTKALPGRPNAVPPRSCCSPGPWGAARKKGLCWSAEGVC